MLRYILNTSYGAWSAGTEVEIVTAAGHDEVIGVSPVNADFDTMFDVPLEFLTKRRNRTDEVALPNRKDRRKVDPTVEIRRQVWIESTK